MNLTLLEILVQFGIIGFIGLVTGFPSPNPQYRCSLKLESALEQMFKKSQSRSGSSSLGYHIDLPSYSLHDYDYDASAGKSSFDTRINEKMDYTADNSGERSELLNNNIEVAELRVRLPQHSTRWVHVDKCNFIAGNRTLDTRLVFPDLTISGRVLIQPPYGGHCDMILRLRQAGIEFRTVPIVEERSRAATVRTDSHFAEPGFISVFAHGCEGLSIANGHKGNKYRPNSKRQQFMNRRKGDGGEANHYYPYGDPSYDHFYDDERYARDFPNRKIEKRYDNNYINRDREHKGDLAEDLRNAKDDIHFTDKLLSTNAAGDGDGDRNSRSFSDYYTNSYYDRRRPPPLPPLGNPPTRRPAASQWENVELANSAELEENYSRELEELFSKGVRGLLTKYMQKALQPAIKETLMESMGYTLSYG